MGVFSDAQLHAILGQFSVAPGEYSLVPLTQGYINDTFIARDAKGPVYILQRINHEVFPNVEGILNNIALAFHYLNGADYHTISLIRTRTGKPFFKGKSLAIGYWRLMTYMDDSQAYDIAGNPKIAHGAGKIIGTFHQLLDQAPKDRFVDTIANFHNLGSRENQFGAALSQAVQERLQNAKGPIGFAQEILEILHKQIPENLPERICHNDTKLNNILFSKTSGLPLCLIDLDTLMKGYFHYDFGDAVRTVVNTAPEDERELDKIVFDKTLFTAFVDGLAEVRPFLNPIEIRALPLGAVLMPFLHGLRALTDYLNGDVYYKISYPGQNLDRCLSLFRFTEKAQAQLQFMTEILAQRMVPLPE
ncbi:MAG: aminoglycoside phosphotransferase family protein [Bacteroidota bacterium]